MNSTRELAKDLFDRHNDLNARLESWVAEYGERYIDSLESDISWFISSFKSKYENMKTELEDLDFIQRCMIIFRGDMKPTLFNLKRNIICSNSYANSPNASICAIDDIDYKLIQQIKKEIYGDNNEQ